MRLQCGAIWGKGKMDGWIIIRDSVRFTFAFWGGHRVEGYRYLWLGSVIQFNEVQTLSLSFALRFPASCRSIVEWQTKVIRLYDATRLPLS